MRSTRRHLMTTTATALLMLAAAACGGDDGGSGGGDSDEVSAAELAEVFVASGAPQDEADCVAEQLEGKVTREQVELFAESEDGSDVPNDLIILIGNAVLECGVGS